MAKKSKVVKCKIADLRPHPRQAELFPDLNDDELAMLASDMELNGLEVPIEISRQTTRSRRPKIGMD